MTNGATRPVHAVLQAGGRGERLRPITDTTPKPLIPVAGMPMVERLLRQLLAAEITSVSVITGWLGNRVERHLSTLNDLRPEPDLSFVRERVPQGTVGGLGFLEHRDRTLLFLFADLVTDLDFARLLDRHASGGADLTLASHVETVKLQLGEIQEENGQVVGYAEKPEKEFTICSGIAVLQPHLLGLIGRGARPFGLPQLVRRTLHAGYRVVHWRHGAFWMDVNSHDALAEAEAALNEPGSSVDERLTVVGR